MGKGIVVDFLVTRIAHFGLAYMILFVPKLGTKRSPPPAASPCAPYKAGSRDEGRGRVGTTGRWDARVRGYKTK